MTFRRQGLLATFLALCVLLTACDDQDDDVTSAPQTSDATGDDCSEPDVDCGGDVRCGDQLPAATDDPTLRVSVGDTQVTTVRAPVVDDEGPLVEGDAKALHVEVAVENTTDEPVEISTTPHLLLADADTSTIVSAGDPQVMTLDYFDTRIPAHETERFDLLVSIGSGRTCDHTDHNDLPAGAYSLLVEAHQVVPLVPGQRQGNRALATHHAIFEVHIP